MKTKRIITNSIYVALAIAGVTLWSCQPDDDNLKEASYPTSGEVFIDTFTGDLIYSAYAGAVPDAFDVDSDVTYNNSEASMRFDVPNVNDPDGAYAGGSFYSSVGRNLTGYDALTFYAKANQAATIAVVGFGNDFGENKYQASVSDLQISTAWKKYIIPIPDASKLPAEKGLFFISSGPDSNGNGYTFWIDEVKFEKLGTIAHPQVSILNGANVTENTYVGITSTITNLACTFNLPNGTNQVVNTTPYYFTFSSSNPNVATVDELGVVTSIANGSSVITASLGSAAATGSLTVNCQGNYVHAPTPTVDADDVVSVFSDTYNNVTVDYYNGYWAPWQTTQSADFTVNGDNVLNYTNFNFVGIQASAPTIDASGTSHFHMDLYLPSAVATGATFQVQVVDYGADATYGGTDDKSHTTTFTASSLSATNWISLEIPFTAMTGLTSRNHIGQIIFVGTNIPSFYADNIYFYNNGSIIPAVPTTAAPTPTANASDVISIFSDSYTNVAGTNLNPNWGQATVTTEVSIAGNNTLSMAGLNYQGIQFGSNQNVSGKTHLHLDFYSANSTSFKIYLISPGPVETPYTLTVPTIGGWNSIDIPLTSFSPVNLANVFQIKFDGNGNIYVDNIYFHN